jgi:hypothetical protein
MKKIITIQILLLIIFANVHAQVNLTLAFNNRPQPYLADWNNAVNGRAIITVTGAANVTAVKFKTTLTNEEGVDVGVTNVAAATLFTLNPTPATSIFSLGDVLQMQNMIFNGPTQSVLQQSGRLRAGTYKLTVQVLSVQGSLLTEKIAVINRVQVFEVYNFQTPMQALRSNTPVLDAEATKGTTQFIWRSNLSMMDTGANRRFIWTLQTLDFNGAPIPTIDVNQQGRSEPAVFTIIKQSANREKVKEK